MHASACLNFATQFRQHLKTHLFRAQKSQRIVTLDCCALYNHSYLLTYTVTVHDSKYYAGDVSHKPGGIGCHYSPAGLQPSRGLLQILLLGEQRHDGCEQFA